MPANPSLIAASSSRRHARHAVLFASVSVTALFLAAGLAEARPLGGWTPTPSAAAIAAAQSGQQEAARAARAASNSLKRATLAIQAQQASQQAARDAARAALNASSVTNGLGVGGLQRAPGAVPGSDLWQGANLPTQFNDGDRTKVNIEQTQQKAILTWDTFHVGGQTDLTFQQQASNWVALNRVLGTDGRPSQILGSINAKGSVYVINQNGIIFGGASQVNVGALIASTAKMSNEQFAKGIYSTGSGSTWTPSFTDAAELLGLREGGGKVEVKAGAQITTHAPADVTQGGGFVLLMGGEVVNSGTVTTQLGQTQLAAGDNFVLRRGYDPENYKFSTTRGNEIAPLFNSNSLAGIVRNDGVISSAQGDITLAGRTIEQNGVLVASTSVNTRGTIHLLNSATDTLGSITLGANSLTTVIPELESDETALNSQRDGLIAASDAANLLRAQADFGAIFNNLSKLADRLDQSRIEIVTGGNVIFKGGTNNTGSLTIAQGGQVSVSAGKRIFNESGSVIDVSGVRDVSLAMSANNILVNIQGNELRDSPVNRDQSWLKNQDVWVDIRDLTYVPAGTGGYDTDRYYTPGGLLEVGGYLANTRHTIGEWSAVGGTITLSAPEVVAQAGSVFDISGGSVRYEAGYILTSNFLGKDGRTYNINNARGDMTFYGLGQGFVREHQRWGITEVWTSPLGRGRVSSRLEDGYTVGRDAGSLILSTPTAIFEGSILADVVQGTRQLSARPDDVTDGYRLSQNIVAQAGQLLVGTYGSLGRMGVYESDIRIGDIADITSGLDVSSLLPSSRTGTLYLNATRLNEQQLGGLNLAIGSTSGSAVRGTITVESDLVLADGGSINLTAPTIDIAAKVSVRSGSVTASNQLTTHEVQGGAPVTRTTDITTGAGVSNVTLRSGAAIDTRGVWTNGLSDPANLRGLAFIDGGDVTLRATGSVTLEAGSRIDASSGAAILANGKTKSGKGGDLSLLAGYNGGSGNLTLNGEIAGFGVNGGGTLTLSTSGFVVIGGELGDLTAVKDGVLKGGTAVPVDLWLAEQFVIPAGTAMPMEVIYSSTTVDPGVKITVNSSFYFQDLDNPIILEAGWTVPANFSQLELYDTNWNRLAPNTQLEKGTRIGYISGTLPAGTVLPAEVFPNGIINQGGVNISLSVSKGSTLGRDHVLEQGTVIPAGVTLPRDTRVAAPLLLTEDVFGRGFSKYLVNGQQGLIVPAATAIAPVMPVYRLSADSYSAPTGSDPSDVFGLWVPDTYTPDDRNGVLVQRGGVDLELLAGKRITTDVIFGGSVTIGAGASITLDPGRKIEIASGGQITVDGAITAHGGEIAILNRGANLPNDIGGLSVWIGENARLDASARAVTATDIRGQLYGIVPDGGTVILGSRGGSTSDSNAYQSTDAFVVLREGSVIDVSGASAELDLLTFTAPGQSATARRTVAGDGGSIVLASRHGIYNEGTLLGRAGGAGASGGTLTIALETRGLLQTPGSSEPIPSRLLAGRVLHIEQGRQASLLPDDLAAGHASDDLKVGYANLSADEVNAGGFDNLSLFARTAIVFDGDVSLAVGRSIALRTSGLYQSVDGGHATVSAPYVTIDGSFLLGNTQSGEVASVLPAWPTTGTITVQGSLIDVVNRMNANVANLTLDSSGDLRFLAYDRIPTSGSYGDWTMLASTGDLELIAQRIYPATDAKVRIYAGTAIDVNGSPALNTYTTPNTGTVTIGRHGDGEVTTPYSVFGRLGIEAGTVRQGGNLFAPLGVLSFKTADPYGAVDPTRPELGLLEFLPGSLTSVSASGLVIPYGGTADGVSYKVDGSTQLPFTLLTGQQDTDADGNTIYTSDDPLGISVVGRSVVSHAGSRLDLSGGGTLNGAAFVSGRGGSVDTLLYPLIASNPGNTYSASGNKVYAIVPGVDVASAGSYYSAWTGAVPGVGQQITIPAGVPGLPAGTYTLLPANYALLPGAYRVELGATGTTGYASANALANGSYLISATRSVAGTAIRDTLFTTANVTPGAAVRSYSQYNEQGYADFQLAQAATLGAVRPLLEADGKFLSFSLLSLAAGSTPRTESALRFAGEADFAGGEGGYGGKLTVGAGDASGGNLVIIGAGSTTQRTSTVLTIGADDLARIGAPNLYLRSGGDLTLESGVVVTGSQVSLAATNIVVKSGASINTLGRGLLVPDFTVTGQFTGGGSAVLVVSNGTVVLTPPSSLDGSVVLEDGASLYSEGSIGFMAGQSVVIGEEARFGTRDLELALPYINIGAAESLASAAASGVLPAGLTLSQSVLDRLLVGDPATGVPGLKNLTLSAANSINFYGSVNLSTLDATGKSLLDSFVLSTPAIYGHGTAGDSVVLTTDRLVWSSRYIYTTSDGTVVRSSATPGAVIANGPGTGQGIFNVNAREIVIGYTDQSQPENTLQFNRLMLGFGGVNFNASERFTSNNNNTLSVYRTGASPTSSFDPATYSGEWMTLKIATPLLTGDNGSVLSVYAPNIRVEAPAGVAPSNTAFVDTLGATINLNAIRGAVVLDTAVALPSGKLTATSEGMMVIDSGARIDLSGRAIPFNDVTKYSWGGDLQLESGELGSIMIYDGATIDVSAVNNNAGSITLLSPELGSTIVFTHKDATPLASLDGMFKGSSTEGYESGSFRLVASGISSGNGSGSLTENFARLNQALNGGGFFETRDFTFKRGDLTIGDEVKAHNVIVSLDGDSSNATLTVAGRIDASGEAPGSIRLSAKSDMVLASTAVLDTHGTVLQTDSDGVAVAAKNRGTIELTAKHGWLRLKQGATLDMSSPDGVSRGQVVLNVPRASETGGNVLIDARVPLNIRGASEIAVNAFWTYSPTDANDTIVQDSTASGVPAGAVGLNQIGARNTLFIDNAWTNTDLQNRLSGLSAYGDAFHLRAGVDIQSGSSGNLTIKGDLDLASLRTKDKTGNATEPGSLVVRARDNLTVNGSVSDGFGAVVSVLIGTQTGDQQTVSKGTSKTFTEATTVASVSIPRTTGVLNFDAVLGANNYVRRGIEIPFAFALDGAFTDTGWTATADIHSAAGALLYSAGQVVTTSLAAGTVFSAGTTLPGTAQFRLAAGTVIPRGISLSTYLAAINTRFYLGAQTLPAGTTLSVSASDNTTATYQTSTPIYGTVTPMLEAGTESWSLRLVSGADTQSADTRAVRTLAQLGGSGNMVLSDTHSNALGQILSSVIRTGTGDLDLIAGRDLTQDSPYGVYSAGSQIDVGSAYSGVTSQGGYFTQGGGDVLISAGRNLSGYIWQTTSSTTGVQLNDYSVDNWLVRQGDATNPAAWGVRFGSYVGSYIYGFSGFGTLGGGNLTVDVGSNAGMFSQIRGGGSTGSPYVTTGLVLAVGSSGWVTSVTKTPDDVVTGGTLVQAGGGDLSLDVGGRLNPLATVGSYVTRDDFHGSFTNVRGDITVQAGAIGSILLDYGARAPSDPRASDPYEATRLQLNGGVGGPVIVIGDGAATFQSRGDLVLGGVGDPGMIFSGATNGPSFSLWRPDTSISLFSAGGDIVPLNKTETTGTNERWSGDSSMLPPIFSAVAANGSLYSGGAYRIELAPSREGYLELLARDSVYGAALTAGQQLTYTPAAWSVSGAKTDPNSIPNPFRPGTGNDYFQFQTDTVTTNLHAGDDKVIRVYALNGDIVNFTLGDPTPIYDNGYLPRYGAAMPARIVAGRDIVNFGKYAWRSGAENAEYQDLPSLILNNDVTDVSVIEAGRDILYAQVQIGGPGSLDVKAGRNVHLGDKGSIVSIGPLAAGDTRPGASILMQAGIGPQGPNYAGLLPYLDPANLAVYGTPLVDQSGRVVKTYEKELQAWLKERYAGRYAGTTDENARSYFAALAPEQQAIFLRTVYFAELKESGREYTGKIESTRLGSYIRGQKAIEALFPATDANGEPITYAGDVTMFSTAVSGTPGSSNYKTNDGSVRTQVGGDIQFLTPGGQIVVSVEGVVPGANAGVMTQFGGGIQMYSHGSILLGLSRIMTNYGDDIFAWSEYGDINAGRGAKTTIGYTPPRVDYDDYGNISLTPSVPQAGAGISARSGIPGVASGNIDLHARRGTIDVGEAGIAGNNINISALHIVNAANISAQGNVTGVPTIQAPNVAGLTEASNVAGSAAQQMAKPTQTEAGDRSSIIIVEVLGFGGGSGGEEAPPADDQRNRRRQSSLNYDPNNALRVLGNGELTLEQTKTMTDEEKRLLSERERRRL